MNSNAPILILQMQRMGDLVLSFPLAGWLKSIYPNTPIWIVGEKAFFEGLVEISPPSTFFSYSDSHALKAYDYSMIINLSHRTEAAKLSGKLRAAKRLGPYIDEAGELHIAGDWQLYRSSISHNNRHNLFHWADLNAMDIIPQISMRKTSWPPVKKSNSRQAPRIGLFVGASEPDKRPEPEFWADLAKKLMIQGAKPVFLGGEGDKGLAAKAAQMLQAPAINLSGHFSIVQLCRFIASLDLLIVPDTGPMHIAAWVGIPILNLSFGPVNPWETGPFAPGHYVLRPPLSCTGCWSCTRKRVYCKERLKAEQVAVIASLILDEDKAHLARLDSAAALIYQTRRDAYGLFDMELLNPQQEHKAGADLRHNIALYWKIFFGLELAFIPEKPSSLEALAMARDVVLAAGLGSKMLQDGQSLLKDTLKAIQGHPHQELKDERFWLKFSPLLRPLSSYIQFALHNGDFSQQSLLQALRLLESHLQNLKSA